MTPVAPWLRSLPSLVSADLRRRYAGSALGAAWGILSPLVEVAVKFLPVWLAPLMVTLALVGLKV